MHNSLKCLRRTNCYVTIALVGVVLPFHVLQGQSFPNPVSLLQGVESARLQIPPSSLTVKFIFKDSLVTNESLVTVDFDGNLRGFTAVSQRADDAQYQTVFDGEKAICYDEGLHQVSYRSLGDQTSMKLFDPRAIGLSAYNGWVDSVENNLPYDIKPNKIELIGREDVENRLAWHVRLINVASFGNIVRDFWIDDTRGFRVYRVDFNGVETYSYYESDSYPWLPSRVIVREFRSASDGTKVLVAERGLEILEAKSNVKLPKVRWTVASMSIKPGADVVDFALQRKIGIWDGKRIVANTPDFPLQTERRSGPWTIIVCMLLVLTPLVIFVASRKPAKALAAS